MRYFKIGFLVSRDLTEEGSLVRGAILNADGNDLYGLVATKIEKGSIELIAEVSDKEYETDGEVIGTKVYRFIQDIADSFEVYFGSVGCNECIITDFLSARELNKREMNKAEFMELPTIPEVAPKDIDIPVSSRLIEKLKSIVPEEVYSDDRELLDYVVKNFITDNR